MENNSHTHYSDSYTPYDTLIEFCIIFLIIFTPLAYGAVEPWSIAVFEVTAGLMALAWIFKNLAAGKIEFVRNPLIIFILLFICYISLQFFLSINTQYSLRNTQYSIQSIYPWATKVELLKVISYVLIFFVTINTLRTKRQIIRILSFIIATGFFMSIFLLMRYFGVKAPRGLINPDHFSGYLGMIIPLALGLLFVGSYTQMRAELKILLFFFVITMGGALFFTMSRGGMFSFVGALLSIALLTLSKKTFKKKWRILSVVVIFIALTIIWLGATPLIERILSIKAEIASRYFGGRLPIWQGTVNIIKDYFIFGTGLGTFSYVFPKYQPLQIIKKHYTHAHSDFLELLSEVGMVGFSIFLFGLAVFIIYVFKRFWSRHDLYVIGMSIGIFGSLTSIFIYSFADFNLHIPSNAILLTLILALVTVLINFKQDKFGERVDFRKSIFKFSKIYPVTDNSLRPIYRELLRISLYPLALVIFGSYIYFALRPVLIDSCFRNTHETIRAKQYAIRLDPANALYRYELGKLYLKSNQLEDALVQYKKAVELCPMDSKYHQSLAWAYAAIERNKEAIQEFKKAVNNEPNNPYRHRAYAIYCFNQARLLNGNANIVTDSANPKESLLNTAIFEYRRAVNIDSSFAGEAIEKLFFFTKDYNKLKQILPNLPEFHLALASFLQEKNAWIENETKFKDEMNNATDKAQYYIAIAQWHYRCKDYNKALSTLYDYLKLYPDNAEVHFTIADFAVYGAQDWKLAFKEAKEAIRLESGNIYYRYWYAKWLSYQKNYREAESECKKILSLNPYHKDTLELLSQCRSMSIDMARDKNNF